MDDITLLLEYGWPGIVMVAIWVLWRAHNARTDAYIRHLQSDIDRLESRYRDCQVQVERLLGDILETVSLRKLPPSKSD